MAFLTCGKKKKHFNSDFDFMGTLSLIEILLRSSLNLNVKTKQIQVKMIYLLM